MFFLFFFCVCVWGGESQNMHVCNVTDICQKDCTAYLCGG